MYKLSRCNAFRVYENKENFFAKSEHLLYGKGPDPLEQIDKTRDLVEQRLAALCVSTRKKISDYLQKKESLDPSETHWAAHLSSDELKGLCGFVSACLNYFIKKIPELNEMTTLVYHQTATLFPQDAGGRHMFVVANVNGRSFIVDLTIRQFFDSTLRLRKEEVDVFDPLLKEGFVELTDHSLTVYRRFLHSQFQYEKNGEKYKNNVLNGWELSLDKLSPMSLESLQTPTAEVDFEDNELEEYLFFTKHKIQKTDSLPIGFQLGHHVPTCTLKGKIRKPKELSRYSSQGCFFNFIKESELWKKQSI